MICDSAIRKHEAGAIDRLVRMFRRDFLVQVNAEARTIRQFSKAILYLYRAAI